MLYTDPRVRLTMLRTLQTLRRLLKTLRVIRNNAVSRGQGERVVWAMQRMAVVQTQIYKLAHDLEVDPDE